MGRAISHYMSSDRSGCRVTEHGNARPGQSHNPHAFNNDLGPFFGVNDPDGASFAALTGAASKCPINARPDAAS